MSRTVVALALLGPLAGCGDDSLVGVRAPTQRPILGFIPELHVEILDQADPAPRFAYPDHVGFEWGVEGTIRYHAQDVEEVADGPSFIYVIDEELDRRVDPVGTVYPLDFWWPNELEAPLFRARPDGGVLMLSSEPVGCEPAMCDELLAAVPPVTVDVQLTAEAIPIRAVAVRPR